MPNPLKNILLVEDELEARLNIDLLLHLNPCQVDFANDGLSAISKAGTQHYDCILMDLSLPILDGLEASKVIKKILKRKSLPIPFIFALSEYHNPYLIESCFEAGITNILFKPLQPYHIQQLFSRLNEFVPKDLVGATSNF